MLNPQWLKSFSMLSETGSFTQAADRLGITQAAVSQHIRQLETQLGPLVLRNQRPLELTPSGKVLINYCDEIRQADKRLLLSLSESETTRGEISLISPGSIGLRLYPLLLSLQEQHSGLTIRHRFAPDSDVIDAVLHNQYELGFITQKPDDRRLVGEPFTREPLELVLPAGLKAKCWEDLEALGFIDHPDGQAMATRLLSRNFPGNAGVRNLPQRGFSNQIGLILEPVARGLGFTVLPQFAREAWPNQAAIAVADCKIAVTDTLWLIHRAEWPLSTRSEQAVNYLRRHFE
jgi:DNA-binding transcriptional LysR family regulator